MPCELVKRISPIEKLTRINLRGTKNEETALALASLLDCITRAMRAHACPDCLARDKKHQAKLDRAILGHGAMKPSTPALAFC